MGGSSKNKECALINCKTKEQQNKKVVAPCTCTLPVPALLCTSSSNAPLCSLSVHVLLLCVPPLAHRLTLFTLSLADSWRDELFWFFFFAMVNSPFVPNKKEEPKRPTDSCTFTPLCQCHLEPETTIGLSFFCHGYIF
jgi:hypothetical protein